MKRTLSDAFGKKSYPCQHCGKVFAESGNRNRHERLHTGEKPFACQHCDKVFATANTRDCHERTHTGRKPFSCRYCDSSFAVSFTRDSHERSQHTGEKPYKCQHCDKAFTNLSNRNKHERMHTGEKPYACQHCGKAFAESGDRDKHERTHTKEKPFPCRHCDKAFTTSGQRTAHERTHTGEKPFPCRHCDKSFTMSCSRNNHERSRHTGEKPYACRHCDKAFSQLSNRDTHERHIHTGEKPYPCRHCDKAFAESGSRKKHERCVHGDAIERPCLGGEKGVCDGNRNGKSKYDGRCVKCFIDFAPNDVRAVNAKAYLHAKEQTVRLFLEQTFSEYRWVFDRAHAVGVYQRPDAKVAIGKTRLLIVEVDEHSHNAYDCTKEREREAILAKHAPKDAVIHLIRFNPDAYDDPVTGMRVPTCFKYSKELGLTTVHPERKDDWDARLATLKGVIDEIVAHKHEDIAVPECLLEDDRYGHVIPIELFYDDVRAKWPDGHKKRLAAFKRNAQVRKFLAEGAAPPPLLEPSDEESESEEEEEDVCLPCA